jgi:hypothetical protein
MAWAERNAGSQVPHRLLPQPEPAGDVVRAPCGASVRRPVYLCLGDAKSSLGGATSSLGDAKSSLGDAKSSLGGATSSLGDAKSSLDALSWLVCDSEQLETS